MFSKTAIKAGKMRKLIICSMFLAPIAEVGKEIRKKTSASAQYQILFI